MYNKNICECLWKYFMQNWNIFLLILENDCYKYNKTNIDFLIKITDKLITERFITSQPERMTSEGQTMWIKCSLYISEEPIS